MVLLFVMEIMLLPKTKLMERDVRKCCFPEKVFFSLKAYLCYILVVENSKISFNKLVTENRKDAIISKYLCSKTIFVIAKILFL